MSVANPYLVEQYAVGIKTETSYGTAATPAVGTDYIYVTTADLTPQMNQVERDYRHNSLNALADAAGDVIVNVVLEGEYQGGAAAGSYNSGSHALELAAGMIDSASVSDAHTYLQEHTASSTSYPCPGKSCTIVGAYRTNLITVTGVYGNLVETHEFNGIVRFRFEGKGLFGGYVAGTQPTPTYTEQFIPVTPSTASVHGYSPEWSKIEINYGNQIETIQDAGSVYGYSKVIIARRKPMISFDMLMDAQGTHDPIGRMIAKTTGSFALTTGTAAGRKIAYTISSCQYRTVDVGNRNGVNIFNISANVVGTFSKKLS